MATYKVIQDIEAEDKILGPLTLRQFIFGLITAFLLYLCFLCLTKGAAFLLVVLLPPAIFTGFFAFPFGRDQPTEIWALAKIRFLFKPRRRIWDQSGVKDLVTITVPKKVERILTNGLSQNEVTSRLKILAETIDSRGWATKNVDVNVSAQPNPLATDQPSDRLIDVNAMPQEVPSYDVHAADDMLDPMNNPVAHQFDTMITASAQTRRQQLIDHLNDSNPASVAANPAASSPADNWFSPQAAASPGPTSTTPTDSTSRPVDDMSTGLSPAADDQLLATTLKARAASQHMPWSHLRTLRPTGTPVPALPVAVPPPDSATDIPAPDTSGAPQHDAAILSLAHNNDLNVATLAREASKARGSSQPPRDEVVISLHSNDN